MARVEVAAAIIERRGKFLITQRTGNQHLAGRWEFPGGKRKWGETLKRCLQRELREELGLEVQVKKRLCLVNYKYQDRIVRISFFRCCVVGGQLRAQEGQPVAWVRYAQLRQRKFPQADLDLIRYLARSKQ